MINDSSQPIFFYPDQLLKDSWPAWVESVLSKIPDDEYKNPRGFQELSGSTDSSGRTRAGESYRLGLLLQRVIRERTKGSSIPKGWQYVCDGKSVISKTGHLSYVIGKALANESTSTEANTGLNVLYLLFALSLGIQFNSGFLSTALIYAWTLREFRKSVGENEFDSHYEDYSRFIAAAVFKTLDSSTHQSNFINEYINSSSPTSLILQKNSDQSIYSVTPSLLSEKIKGDPSTLPNVNDIPSAKAPLFWSSVDRGIFQRANTVGNDLIQSLIPIDQLHWKQNGTGVLTKAIHVSESEDHMLLEKLDEIFNNITTISPLWSLLMEKLADGVYSALAFVENSANRVTIPTKFHLHGISTIPNIESSFTVELYKETVPIKPQIGSSVMVNNKEFLIKTLTSSDTHFMLELEAS